MREYKYFFSFFLLILLLSLSSAVMAEETTLQAGQKVHGTFEGNTNACGFCHVVHSTGQSEYLFQEKINGRVNNQTEASNDFCSFCHDGTGASSTFATIYAENTGRDGFNEDFDKMFTEGDLVNADQTDSSATDFRKRTSQKGHASNYTNLLKGVLVPAGTKDSDGNVVTLKSTALDTSVLPYKAKTGSNPIVATEERAAEIESHLMNLHVSCVDCHSPHGSENAYNLKVYYGLKIPDSEGKDTRKPYYTSAAGRMQGKHVDTYYFCTNCHNGKTRIQANVDITGNTDGTADNKLDEKDYITLYDVTTTADPDPLYPITNTNSHKSRVTFNSTTPGSNSTKSCGTGCHQINTTVINGEEKTSNMLNSPSIWVHEGTVHRVLTHY